MTAVPPDLEAALRASWSVDTCDTADKDDWSPDHPSRGQCGTTALVLHDHLGGVLLLSEVLYDDGTRQGWHWGNRLPDGTDVDLTGDQFLPHEHVQPAVEFVRPATRPRRCAAEYDLLSRRVAEHLAADR